jgi:hypothetical protein
MKPRSFYTCEGLDDRNPNDFGIVLTTKNMSKLRTYIMIDDVHIYILNTSRHGLTLKHLTTASQTR